MNYINVIQKVAVPFCRNYQTVSTDQLYACPVCSSTTGTLLLNAPGMLCSSIGRAISNHVLRRSRFTVEVVSHLLEMNFYLMNVTSQLALQRLCLSQFAFDFVQYTNIGYQVSGALSRLLLTRHDK